MLLLLAAPFTRDLAELVGLVCAVLVAEIAREIRAWHRGKRLRDVERDIHRCLINHPTRRKKRQPSPPDPGSSNGSNKP